MFDDENSVIDEIPVEIREKLIGLYLNYADDAVMKRGSDWEKFELAK
jgi:hypothetical protein